MHAARGKGVRRALGVVRTVLSLGLLAPLLLHRVHVAVASPLTYGNQRHPRSSTKAPAPRSSHSSHTRSCTTYRRRGSAWSSQLGVRLALSDGGCGQLSFVSTVRSCALRARRQHQLRTWTSSRRTHRVNAFVLRRERKPAGKALAFAMGASTSRHNSPQQRSALIGGDENIGGNGNVGLESGYGAAASNTLLRGAASSVSGLDPEDPTSEAGGLGAGERWTVRTLSGVVNPAD